MHLNAYWYCIWACSVTFDILLACHHHSFVFYEEHLATQYLKNISNIFAKLLFKIKLCLNLSSCYQNWLPCWLCFVHAIIVILLITDFKVLFLLWICTWLLQTMLTSSSDKLKTLTIYFSLSFCCYSIIV